MNSRLSVWTPKDVAEVLKVEEEAVLELLGSGQLRGFQVAGSWRTTEQLVEEFIHGQTRSAPKAVHSEYHKSQQDEATLEDLREGWERIEGGFRFSWPNMEDEVFDTAFAGMVRHKGRNVPLVIGIGDRRAAGQERRRAVVFWGTHPGTKNPLVEFAGANDFADTKIMASVIKVDGRKHLQPADDLPEAYVGLPTGVYNRVVVGKYAWDSQCVLAHENELEIMAMHALIRAEQKGSL